VRIRTITCVVAVTALALPAVGTADLTLRSGADEAVLAAGSVTAAAAPPPCGGVPQISDAAGDGHHANTDVLAGWLSEQAGRLQAVIQVRQGLWEPAHDDSEVAGFAFLFELGGQVRYVRAEAPRQAPPRFDFGTWTRSGGFVSGGGTMGVTEAGSGGAVTIDVPAQTGAVPGAVLARPFVLTYDGTLGADKHWVDRGPGGVSPDGTEAGADLVVGSCSGPAPGTGGGGAVRTTSVVLSAPRKLVGGGRALISGRVTPARAGVPVEVSATGHRTVVRRLITAADGSFASFMRISETTRLRAVAEGIGSQTRTLTVFSRVRIKIQRLRGGGALVRGRVRPALPGRVLWLRTTAAQPTARTKARNGRFRIRLQHPRRGRYQAVFIPSGKRAERSTSNTGVIK
jgi:hypothetical protein